MQLLRFNAKQIRSREIKRYMLGAGIERAVCFSCGNASRELKNAGVDVIDISPTGDLLANRWFKPEEINRTFQGCFDATSGHLPLHLMKDIALAFKKELGYLPNETYYVPTGSGETILCLKIAYPITNFVAVYDLDSATEYNSEAPLNEVVEALFPVLHGVELYEG